jgi:5-methylcytosine-specific restriction endonuclease McrA
MVLNGKACLVLNGDYSPLNICTVLRAVKMVFAGRAEIIEGSNGALRTVSAEFPLPTVVRISHKVRLPKVRVRLSRKAVLSRDRYMCQYCGKTGPRMTVDHLVPKNKGGSFEWDNLVCACPRCNSRKGGRTLTEAGMRVLSQPREPSYFILSLLYHTQGRRPDSAWGKYLPPGLWKLASADSHRIGSKDSG